MNLNLKLSSRRRFFAGGLAAVLSLAISGAIAPTTAHAHETDCPHCKLKVVQDTATQDNEVALRYGRKRIEYRCLVCALTDAKTAYKNDVTIQAPSETNGKYITLSRKNGQWSAPDGAVFLSDGHADHSVCYRANRAFTSRAALDNYARKNGVQIKNAKAVTLAELTQTAAAKQQDKR